MLHNFMYFSALIIFFLNKKEPTSIVIIFKYSTINQLINNNQLKVGSSVKILKIFYFLPVLIPKIV